MKAKLLAFIIVSGMLVFSLYWAYLVAVYIGVDPEWQWAGTIIMGATLFTAMTRLLKFIVKQLGYTK